MFNLCNIFEVNRIWDTEALHLVGVTPILEVLLESPTAPVAGTTANLALELLTQAVQLEEPIGDGFAIPAHGQVLRVILDTIFIIIGVISCDLVR